jgi:hypothetical protein
MIKEQVLLLIIILLIVFSHTISGQDITTDLETKKITINMENKPLRDVFRHLIVEYDVPIGFEESILDRDHMDFMFRTAIPDPNEKKKLGYSHYVVKNIWFTVKAEEASLKDVLDIIVGQMKNYDWEINDGVVNIYPKTGRDERYKNLLDVKIKSFELPIGSPVFMIRNKIFKLPEIKEFLNKNGIYSTSQRSFIENMKRPLPAELVFENISFRQLLNKITFIKRGGWILKTNHLFGSEHKEYIEIDI